VQEIGQTFVHHEGSGNQLQGDSEKLGTKLYELLKDEYSCQDVLDFIQDALKSSMREL